MAAGTPSLTFEAHGVTVALTFNDPGLLDCAERHLPWGSRLIEPAKGCVPLHVDSAGYVHPRDGVAPRHAKTRHDRHQVAARFAAQLRHHVALHSPELFVHAGAVAVDGGALILPGRSYAGKSTLVAALLRAGAQYLSDEYAVVDEQGFVRPFAKPVSVRDHGRPTARNVSAQELGAQTARVPMPARLIALTKFSAAATWDPRPLGSGETIMALLENTVAVRATPERALRRLRLLCDGAAGVQGERGEADLAASDLIARMKADRH